MNKYLKCITLYVSLQWRGCTQFTRTSTASFKTNTITFKLKFSHCHHSSGGFKSLKSGHTQKEKFWHFNQMGGTVKAHDAIPSHPANAGVTKMNCPACAHHSFSQNNVECRWKPAYLNRSAHPMLYNSSVTRFLLRGWLTELTDSEGSDNEMRCSEDAGQKRSRIVKSEVVNL
jgi:hypothetical protein